MIFGNVVGFGVGLARVARRVFALVGAACRAPTVRAAGVLAAVKALFLPLLLSLSALAMPMTAAAQSQTGDGGVSNAMLAEQINSVNDSIDSVRREIDSVHREIASVRRESDIRREETHAKIDSLAVNTNTRFESLMNQMNTRFESLMHMIDALESKMTWLGWAVGLIGTAIVALIALVVFFFTDMRRQNAESRQQSADMQRQILAMQRQIDAALRQLSPQAEVVEIPSPRRQMEPQVAADTADTPDDADAAPPRQAGAGV